MITFLKNNLKKFNYNVKLHLESKYIYAYVSLLWCYISFGCSHNDYFRYAFYKKSNYDRNKFITYRRSKGIIRKYNDKAYITILENKANFNVFFSDFIEREWLCVNNASFKEFESFIKRFGSVIIKPLCGGQGKGIHKYVYSLGDDLLEMYQQSKGCIIEEVLVQNSKLSSLNPTSVNTVRVATFVTKAGEVKIIACSLRTGGNEGCVDNLNAKGICVSVK